MTDTPDNSDREYSDVNDNLESEKKLYISELPKFQEFVKDHTQTDSVNNDLTEFVENPEDFIKVSSPIQRLALGKLFKKYKDKKKMDKVIELFKVNNITKNINSFDGDKSQIYNFINSVDEILALCEEIKELDCFKVIQRNIRQKITGRANQSITNHNVPNEWEKIKKHLIEQFADKRDEANLLFELYGLVKQNLEPKVLYDKICSINSLLSNQLKIKDLKDEIVDYQLQQYRSTCLIIFMASLKEPVGTWLRARDPKNLEDAYEYVVKEDNIKTLKGINNNQSNKNTYRHFSKYPNNPNYSNNQVKNEPGTSNSNNNKSFYNKTYPNKNFQNKYVKQESNTYEKPYAQTKVEKGKVYNIETSIENENFQGEASEDSHLK